MLSWIKKYWVYIAIAVSIGVFLLFKKSLNENSQSLMVLITAIYVIATINISNANIESAKATRLQVKASIDQYEELKRLNAMPYLMCEQIKSGLIYQELGLILSDEIDGISYAVPINISNIGNGTAKDIHYIWTNFVGSYDRGSFPAKAMISKDEKCFDITFIFPRKAFDNTVASIDLKYKDLLENSYQQKIQFIFVKKEHGLTLQKIDITSPELS